MIPGCTSAAIRDFKEQDFYYSRVLELTWQALDHRAWLNWPWGAPTDLGIEGESSRVVWVLY